MSEREFEWGKYMDGQLLAAWPKDASGEPEEPAFLCTRPCTDMTDQLLMNMLWAYGIPCLRMERAEGGLGRIVLGISGYGVDIYVPKSLADDARVLIQEDSNDEEL